MELTELAASMNVLSRFCGLRDLAEPTPQELRAHYGIAQADVMVLFGGSVLCGGDVLAEAMRAGAAAHYVIVGGEGHTTQTLRDKMQAQFPGWQTQALTEAELFQSYLCRRYGLAADALECRSTNCGNNVSFLLALLRERRFASRSILLCQDAAMQRRMDAVMRLLAPKDTLLINYAAYEAVAEARDNALVFAHEIQGMWEPERYLSLLLGEIPRLRDDAQGYGPCGKGFLAHVEIPDAVERAFQRLSREYQGSIRKAEARFAKAGDVSAAVCRQEPEPDEGR